MSALAITATEQLVDTAGRRIFTRQWVPPGCGGSAAPSPFVLLHDSLGSVELWRDFPERLAASTGRTVIAYDRLGFGRSDARRDTLAIDFVRTEGVSSLPALKASFGFERAILLGHSVGGGMSVAAAAAMPDMVEAVVTLAAQAFVEDRTTAGIRVAKAQFAAPGQVERLARYHGDKSRWVLDAWIETWLSDAFASWNIDEDLRGLKCPILAIHGETDEYGSRAHPERIGRLAASFSDVHLLNGCGHFPHREKPDAVLEAIAAFLERLAIR